METVFHDVPFVAGPKIWSKASHVAGKVYSHLTLSRDLALIDLSAIALHNLGISRKDLIECDGSQYPETRAWALALHDQHPDAEGVSPGLLARPILSALSSYLKIASPVRRLLRVGRRLHFCCPTAAQFLRFLPLRSD
jgi:hypothetical protein